MPRLSLSFRLIATLACATVGAGLRAELIKVSPFMPPQGAANAPTQNAPLEFRGWTEFDGTEQYRVVDPQKKVGNWLKIGERDANLDVVVKQHDVDHETITVEHGGQTLTLPLKTPKVVSAGSAPQIVPPAMPSNVSPAVLQTVVPNPTPADEQRRLEAVAAEVARRRALREQAAQQAQGMPQQAPQQAAPTYQQLQQQQGPRGARTR